MRSKNKPLIVIPVYNHGGTLAGVVSSALKTGFPVLVIDDGSEDDCLAVISHLDCQTIRISSNMGKGSALLKGAEEANRRGYTTMITIDADGQHNPMEIPHLVSQAAKIDGPCLVIGARRMVEDSIPTSSHFGKHFSNFWVKLECGYDLPDTQSGFRLYPVKELLQLRLRCKRYDFEIESLVKLAWAGIPVRSVDVSVHYPTGNARISHFHKVKDNARLTRLHSGLILRRLIPLPHAKLTDNPPLSKKIKEQLQSNPLKTLSAICKEHASPFWLAVAVWLGLFMGALPLIALHTLAIIYVSHRLHLNIVAAVAASQFCMPPVVPVICIQTGYFFRHGAFLLDLSWQHWLLEIHLRLWEWFLGSLLVGPLLGFIGGAIIYGAAVRFRSRFKTDSRQNS